MILDTYDTVYVWVGRGANKKEKEESLRVATVSILMWWRKWRCGLRTVPFPLPLRRSICAAIPLAVTRTTLC